MTFVDTALEIGKKSEYLHNLLKKRPFRRLRGFFKRLHFFYFKDFPFYEQSYVSQEKAFRTFQGSYEGLVSILNTLIVKIDSIFLSRLENSLECKRYFSSKDIKEIGTTKDKKILFQHAYEHNDVLELNNIENDEDAKGKASWYIKNKVLTKYWKGDLVDPEKVPKNCRLYETHFDEETGRYTSKEVTYCERKELEFKDEAKTFEEKYHFFEGYIGMDPADAYFSYADTLEVTPEIYSQLSVELKKCVRGLVKEQHYLWEARKILKKLLSLEDPKDWIEEKDPERRLLKLKEGMKNLKEEKKLLWSTLVNIFLEEGDNWWY